MTHTAEIVKWLKIAVNTKYSAGQKEHGGNLLHKPALEHMGEEIIDLLPYYHTHAVHWEMVGQIAEMGIAEEDVQCPYLIAIRNIVRSGNVKGHTEEELARAPDEEMSVKHVNAKEIAREIMEQWLNNE